MEAEKSTGWAVPVTYLLLVGSRFTCFAYSVKMDPGPLNVFSWPADTEALSAEGTAETFQEERVLLPGVCILLSQAPAAWATSPAAGSCSIPRFFGAQLLQNVVPAASGANSLPWHPLPQVAL